jgi:hypothetical protein
MKTHNAKQGDGKAATEPGYLAEQAIQAQKQAEAARKRARLAKAKFKQARKAYKQAKKNAKQARREAKIIARALKSQAKSDLKAAKSKAAKRTRTRPVKHQPRVAAPRVIVRKPIEPAVVVRSEAPVVIDPAQAKSSRTTTA